MSMINGSGSKSYLAERRFERYCQRGPAAEAMASCGRRLQTSNCNSAGLPVQ